LPDKAFTSLQQLEYLYLANNKLTVTPRQLPNTLSIADFAGNHLTEIFALTFGHKPKLSKMKGLQYLDLSNNNLTKVPEGLPANIVVLQLGRNRITSISRHSLNRIRNLEYLLLQHNRITAGRVHKEAFGKLRKLHTLHIFNNPLGKIPAVLPGRLSSLMLLHNAILKIGADDFASAYHLTDLNLSHNRLRSARLHRLAFGKLRRLERLDLSANQLSLLPSGLPPSLLALRAQGNQISQLPTDALLHLSSLRELHLHHNLLTIGKIAPGVWRNVPNLKLLDLGHNDLSYVPPDLPESLEYIYLQNNRITTITSNSFISTPNIKVIALRSNRLTSAGVRKGSFGGLRYLQVLDLTGNPEYINVFLHSTTQGTAGSNRTTSRQG
ncbi:hypothetical protein chiPu_0019156, partial [Chiloscyllium punctatum]|nr:hypothetical protein [Chiloscyllium punctatum]